jgi:TPR repeat protein
VKKLLMAAAIAATTISAAHAEDAATMNDRGVAFEASGDIKSAIYWYERAAVQGEKTAQCILLI